MTTPTITQTLQISMLEQLEAELPREDVLSAIINLNPAHPQNDGPALETRVRHQLHDLGVPRARARGLLERLHGAQQETGKTRAFFLWPDGERSFAINLDLPESYGFGQPKLEPLLALAETYPLTVVALADHRWGRLFTLDLGWLTERVRLERIPADGGVRSLEPLGAVVPASPDERTREHRMDRNTDNDRIARNRAHDERQFAKAVAGALQALRQPFAFRQVILGGTLEGITALRAELNHELGELLVGEFAGPTDAPVERVLEESLGVLELARVDSDRRLLDDAREHGALGPHETLTGIQEGRVYHLLVAGDGSKLRLWRETSQQSPYVFDTYPPQGQSPLSGTAVEGISLRDALPELRERFGLRVSHLGGEPARTLENSMGGMAGLIRYKTPRSGHPVKSS